MNRLGRLVDVIYSFGFSLIVGSIIYFIVGAVASLVHSHMLSWSFCSSAHYLFGVEWCDVYGTTEEHWLNHFIHRLLNVALPWFLMFWGFVLIGICSVLQIFLGRTSPR
jgi:hypothetical protein